MAKPKQGRGPWVLAAGAAVQLLSGIPAAWGVLQKPVMQGYGLTNGQATLGFAVLVAGYGAGCAIGGLLQDEKGPRTAALWGTLLLGGGFLAGAVAPYGNAPLFWLVYSLPAGLGSAFLAPAVLSCAQKWYAGRKGLATGVAGVSMGFSGAFYTLVVRLAGDAWGIRGCFLLLGVLVAVLCGGGALGLQNPPRPAQKPLPGIDHRQMLRTPQYRLCVAAVALAAPPVLLFSPEILQLAEARGMPPQAAGWCVAIGSGASAAGRLLLPVLSDKWGRKGVLYGVYAGLAVGSVLFAFAGGWWVAACYAWLTFFYSGGAAVQPSYNSDLFGLRYAGVNYGFLALGMSGGSLLSYAGSRLGLGLRHAVAAGCAVAGAICLFFVKTPPQVEKTGKGR